VHATTFHGKMKSRATEDGGCGFYQYGDDFTVLGSGCKHLTSSCRRHLSCSGRVWKWRAAVICFLSKRDSQIYLQIDTGPAWRVGARFSEDARDQPKVAVGASEMDRSFRTVGSKP
jgi:hypothetical protein